MTPSKSEQAYALLRGRISNGELVAGYRLVLGTIAAELGCSVVPVREAVRRLEAEGLVTFERNVGATVAGTDPELYLHTMQTLAVIEGAATALAAPRLGAEDLAAARELNAQMRRCLEDFDARRFSALNNEFHSALYERCPNPHILDLVHRGWSRLRAMRMTAFSHVPGRARKSVEEHDALLDLLESGGAPGEIESAARAHRMHTLNAFLEAAGQEHSAI